MNKPKQKLNPDTFGRRRTFGYPVDISGMENRGWGANSAGTAARGRNRTFLEAFHTALLRLNKAQGNPYTILIKPEEEKLDQEIKEATLKWLEESLKRLPKNQEFVSTYDLT